eukprot:6492681-Amphidinium_carterae.3
MCAGCYKFWHAGFKHLEFKELVDLSKSEDFKGTVQKARAVFQNTQRPPEVASSVNTSTSLGYQVERHFLGVSEKEMRKAGECQRIKKSVLAKVPSITIPAEDGQGSEQLFLFADSTHPLRRVKLTVMGQTTLQGTVLDEKKVLWPEQPEKYHEMAVQSSAEAIGTSDIFTKDAQGHLHLMPWDDFLSGHLQGNSADVEEVGTAPAAADSMEMVGVAADSILPSELTVTPKDKGKRLLGKCPPESASGSMQGNTTTGSLKRSKSSGDVIASLGAGGGGPPNDGSTIGDDEDDEGHIEQTKSNMIVNCDVVASIHEGAVILGRTESLEDRVGFVSPGK